MSVVVDRPVRGRVSPPSTPRKRRSLLERVTVNMVVGVVAAMVAFVAVASVLRDRREMVTVASARQTIVVGTPITEAMVSAVRLPASSPLASQLVSLGSVRSSTLVASRTLQAGEPIVRSAVGSSEVSGRRVMSMPLASWQAAGGLIEVGDLVDVIDASKTPARYILTGALVTGRTSNDSRGGLASGLGRSDLTLTIEVDAQAALDLAPALEAGKVQVVRSTGAVKVAS